MPLDDTKDGLLAEKKCVVCGKVFRPAGLDDQCCSPICRTLRITKEVEERKKSSAANAVASLQTMSRPPKFDLSSKPKARAEWFMSIPTEYRGKFLRFLTPKEKEWIKEIAKKDLAEDRFFSGIYVKKGKIVEMKSSSDEEDNADAPPSPDLDDDGFED